MRAQRLLAAMLVQLLAWCAQAGAGADPYLPQRLEMVRCQIEARGVSDPRVLAAMRRVPRHRFVPPRLARLAYRDYPLPIGQGQTISQPFMVAVMTEALRLGPKDKVLEVGTGSGYQAAVLAQVAGQVYSIEIIPQLQEQARARLARLGYGNIHLRTGDGYLGWPEAAPFQGIIVTCAPERIPAPLLEQLAPGGRMVIPVGPRRGVQELVLVEKDQRGNVHKRRLMPVRFVPLVR